MGEATADLLLQALDHIPAHYGVWDHESRLLFANHEAARWLGIPRSEAIGRTRAELSGDDGAALTREFAVRALAGEASVFERDVTDSDGNHRYFHVTYAPYTPGEGVVGFTSLATVIPPARQDDVNDQVALQNARQAYVSDVGTALDRVLDGSLRDAEERLDLEDIDLALAELRGLVGELKGTPDDACAPVRRTSLHLEGGPPTRRRTPQLEQRDIPASADRSTWSAGELHLFFDQAPDPLAVFDADLRVVLVNRAATTWLERTAAEVVGRHITQLEGPGLAEANAPLAKAALAGVPQLFWRSVGGAPCRHLQVAYVPLTGGAPGLLVMTTDITERVNTESAAEADRRDEILGDERTRLAEDLHDVVIQQIFAAGLVLKSAAESGVPTPAVDSASHLLAAARTRLERLRDRQRGSRPDDFLTALGDVAANAARALGYVPVLEYVGPLHAVPIAVADELISVLNEGLSNAVRHATASDIVVRVICDDTDVELQVADDGRGMDGTSGHSGTANMRARAERLGGTCVWERNEPRGTLVRWRVPLPQRVED